MSDGGRVAFCLSSSDLFGETYHYTGGFSTTAPASNAQNVRPGIAAVADDAGANSRFAIEAGVNDALEFDEGGGDLTATLTAGVYTWSGLASEIGTQMTAVGGSYTVSSPAGRTAFKIDGGATFSIHWDTGPTETQALAATLGFSTAADDTGASFYEADEDRYTGEVFIVIRGTKSLNPAAVAALLSGDDDTDYSAVKLYGHTADLGDLRSGWDGVAAYEASFSARTTEQSDNVLQLAIRDPATASAYVWWAFSWRFEDPTQYHRLHLLPGLGVTVDDTNNRTMDADGFRRGLVFTGGALEIGDLYPEDGLLMRPVEMAFSRWEAASVRDVVYAVARLTPQSPLLWFEDWDAALTASSAELSTMTDNGQALWCTATVGDISWLGSSSAYASGTVSLRQLR